MFQFKSLWYKDLNWNSSGISKNLTEFLEMPYSRWNSAAVVNRRVCKMQTRSLYAITHFIPKWRKAPLFENWYSLNRCILRNYEKHYNQDIQQEVIGCGFFQCICAQNGSCCLFATSSKIDLLINFWTRVFMQQKRCCCMESPPSVALLASVGPCTLDNDKFF